MRRDKHIRMIIRADGTCAGDAINFTGPSCQAATGEITTALGGQINHQQLKPEARIRERCGQNEREEAR